MLRIYKAEFSKKVKNIEARTKKLYSYKINACIIKDFNNCFREIGSLVNREYHIEPRDDVKSVIAVTRKIPIALKEKLNKELHRMEKLGRMAEHARSDRKNL